MYTRGMYNRKQHGFTIVELLIVIVVIGILAAITIVVFNGIQSRAQLAAVKSDSNQAQKQIELFVAETGTPPASINDCPTPASGNICVKSTTNIERRYAYVTANAIPSASVVPGYEIGVLDTNQFNYSNTSQHTGANEFLRYANLVSYIDKYGAGKKYKLDFEIRSANISGNSSAMVYFQNGSGARYSFNVTVPVTTSFVRHSVTITPQSWFSNDPNAFLAFYGTYNTGNILTVKNVSLQLQE